jgi:hypothetical protein
MMSPLYYLIMKSMFAFGPNLLLHLLQPNPVNWHYLLSSWPVYQMSLVISL